jgi:hypothetical protein
VAEKGGEMPVKISFDSSDSVVNIVKALAQIKISQLSINATDYAGEDVMEKKG